MGNNSSVIDSPKKDEKSPTDNQKYNIDRCVEYGLISDENFWSIAIVVHFFLSYISGLEKDDKLIKFMWFLKTIHIRFYIPIDEKSYDELKVFFSRFLDPNDFTTWTKDVKNVYWRESLPDGYKTDPIDSIPLKLRHNAYVPYIKEIYPRINVSKENNILIDDIIKNGLEYKANSKYDLLAYGIYHTLKEHKFTDTDFINLTGSVYNDYNRRDANRIRKRRGEGYLLKLWDEDSKDKHNKNELLEFQNLYFDITHNEEYKKMFEYAQIKIDDIPDKVKNLLTFMVRYC